MKNIENVQTTCNRCVMDTSDPKIVFTKTGCNHCDKWFKLSKEVIKVNKNESISLLLTQKFADIKKKGEKNKYDCIIGLSGGVDSSYLVLLAYKFNLRVLVTHLDNHWNNSIAEENIRNIIKFTGYDLERYTVDWEEFRDLQLSYLESSVINIEATTDNALAAYNYKIAKDNGIKYLFHGNNWGSEGISVGSWGYSNRDVNNMKDIHKKHGKLPALSSIPTMGLLKERIYYRGIKRIQKFTPLNYINYNIAEAKKELKETFGWRNYGFKHGESIFTSFYQRYILPKKFGADKRKMHLSTLVCSGQITREEALNILRTSPYSSKDEEKKEKNHVINQWNISEEYFDDYISRPEVLHNKYKTDERTRIFLKMLLGLRSPKKAVSRIKHKIKR